MADGRSFVALKISTAQRRLPRKTFSADGLRR
jgi:hypothetical protein